MKAAGVGEHTYAAGKQVLAAVAEGKLPPHIVTDINNGAATIHGVAKALKRTKKAKPARRPKSSDWQTLVRKFSTTIRRVIQRDPRRRAEVAAELRRLAGEFESAEKAAT